jgi:hypothetical protein
MTALKRLPWLLALLFVGTFILAGCGNGDSPNPFEDLNLTIVVTGTRGIEFKGEWEVRGIGVHSNRGVEDVVPVAAPRRLTYDVAGTIISMRFEKRQAEGDLRVEIREGDIVIVRLDTSEPFGVLTLSAE